MLCPNCRVMFNHGRCNVCGLEHRLKHLDTRRLPRRRVAMKAITTAKAVCLSDIS